MKKLISVAASAALVAAMMCSCATINSGAAIGEKGPVGQKIGEAQSTYFLGLWSSQGEQNNMQ